MEWARAMRHAVKPPKVFGRNPMVYGVKTPRCTCPPEVKHDFKGYEYFAVRATKPIQLPDLDIK